MKARVKVLYKNNKIYCRAKGNIVKAYKFRIYPDSKRREKIGESISLAQKFYNKILEKSIKEHKVSMQAFNRFSKEIIEEDESFKTLYSQTRCEIKYRVLKSYKNFFKRLKKGNGKKGFPRFKSYDKYKSITYPQDNGSFCIERIKGFNRLRIVRIGTIKMEMHRGIEGRIKTLTVVKEGNDYYAVFTAIKEMTIPKIEDTNPVGIDMGINNFIALSDGQTIRKPNFFKQKEKRIARWQRIVARRKKGSKRREKAKIRLSEEWKGITNQSNNFMHKLSNILVNSGFTSFAVEALNIQNMQRNHRLAQSIQNASWSRFINFLSYKAESAGMKVIEVDAKNTSKECSNCGNIIDMPLSERTFNCDRCRLQLDRDINASINILHKATTLGQRGSDAQGDSVRPQQEAGIMELGTYLDNTKEAHSL